MIKIVVGGQINKQEIADYVQSKVSDKASVEVKGDLEAAMAMKSGEYDYYIGACNTGGGGALAMAIAILGADLCETISMPGKMSSKEDIEAALSKGKKAFGFTAQHANDVLEILLSLIVK